MAKVFTETMFIDGDLVASEDGGRALIVDDDGREPRGDEHMFVRLQSWDNDRQHSLLKSLIGKTVKITIEIVED